MALRHLIDRRLVEALLKAELDQGEDRRLLLVNARYDSAAPTEFTTRLDGRQRQVRVIDQESVLGIVDAWQRLLAEQNEGSLLVVASDIPATVLGWDLRAHAVGRRTLTVDRAELVKQQFKATDLDPRMVRETWLLDALLEAEPTDGWPPGGSVLTRDAAVEALLGERLGLRGSEPGRRFDLDLDALLTWSRTAAGPARFAELRDAERAGLSAWLAESVGSAAATLLALVTEGRGHDAMALGVLGSLLSAPEAPAETSFALGASSAPRFPPSTNCPASPPRGPARSPGGSSRPRPTPRREPKRGSTSTPYSTGPTNSPPKQAWRKPCAPTRCCPRVSRNGYGTWPQPCTPHPRRPKPPSPTCSPTTWHASTRRAATPRSWPSAWCDGWTGRPQPSTPSAKPSDSTWPSGAGPTVH